MVSACLRKRRFLNALVPLLCICARAEAQEAPPSWPESDEPSEFQEEPTGLTASGRDMGVALERGRSLYQAGRFERCRQAYGEVLDNTSQQLLSEVSSESLEQARVYYASCLLAIGEHELAQGQIKAALHENPLMASPDPVAFPSQVRDLFFTVKAGFLEEVREAQERKFQQAAKEAQERLRLAEREQQRVRVLEELAATETLVQRNRRWLAAVPFGVGQFQNGDNGLGAVFLTVEAATLLATVGAMIVQLDTHAQAGGPDRVVGSAVRDEDAFNETLNDAHEVQRWAFGGFLFATFIGIMEAQINFVQERPAGTRRRLLPEPVRPNKQSLKWRPTVTPVSDGAQLGIVGHF